MRRKAPLRRKTYLQRGPWRKAGKAKHVNSYRKRERFVDWMLWIKDLPCAARNLSPDSCCGAIEADHIGLRAMGRKCHDFECLPLCKKHHDARPGRRSPFSHMDKMQMRTWVVDALRELHLLANRTQSPDAAARGEWLANDGARYQVTT